MTWYEWIELIGECVIIAVPAVMLITWRIRSNRRLLQQEIPGSVYCKTLPEVTEFLRGIVMEGDVVLTVGAGDIFRAGEALLK